MYSPPYYLTRDLIRGLTIEISQCDCFQFNIHNNNFDGSIHFPPRGTRRARRPETDHPGKVCLPPTYATNKDDLSPVQNKRKKMKSGSYRTKA